MVIYAHVVRVECDMRGVDEPMLFVADRIMRDLAHGAVHIPILREVKGFDFHDGVLAFMHKPNVWLRARKVFWWSWCSVLRTASYWVCSVRLSPRTASPSPQPSPAGGEGDLVSGVVGSSPTETSPWQTCWPSLALILGLAGTGIVISDFLGRAAIRSRRSMSGSGIDLASVLVAVLDQPFDRFNP